jgi:hypothetical protein
MTSRTSLVHGRLTIKSSLKVGAHLHRLCNSRLVRLALNEGDFTEKTKHLAWPEFCNFVTAVHVCASSTFIN